jgi:hypothetical protein
MTPEIALALALKCGAPPSNPLAVNLRYKSHQVIWVVLTRV